MRRAHLLRSLGGGLGGPLRSLPQEWVARAKRALSVVRDEKRQALLNVICKKP